MASTGKDSGLLNQTKVKFLTEDASAVATEVDVGPSHEQTKQETVDEQSQPSQDLPRKADRLTLAIVIVLIIGGLERAAFYAVTTPWQNYMQNYASEKSPPGALGLGQSKATSISNSYMVFSSLTPIPFAIAADLWLGRYKALLISLSLCTTGCIVQLITSIPVVLSFGAGPPGLAVSMILMGIGTGGVRAVISPFLGDQYPHQESRTIEGPDRPQIVIDYRLTLQFIYNVFYGVINFACLSTIPATFLEKQYGFWAAFTFATSSMCLALASLITTSSRLVKVTPGENVLVPASRVLTCAARNGFSLERAKCAYQANRHGKVPTYTDSFVDEVRVTMRTCRILLSYAIFYLCANQMVNNLVSQAAQMRLSGIPNDMIPSFASIACVALAPILQKTWNFLALRRITFSALFLIELSFLLCAVAIGLASLTQHLIYTSPPCYSHPRRCEASGAPNDISVWVQIPTYLVGALAETIGFVTANEYAYSQAPQNAKSMIQALSQLAAALGSILGLASSPAARDPWMVIYYAALAGGMLFAAVLFWWLFGKSWRRNYADERD